MKCCCFTGYRPEKMPFPYDKNNKEYIEFEKKLASAIEDAVADGYDTFYSGGARGFDLLAAEIVISLQRENDINLIIAVPFREQAKAYKDDWIERYERVLELADEIVYVSENYSRGCYADRNKYMVDRSERVITFYDGKSGGTRNTVQYAHRNGKKVVNIYSPSGQMEIDF